MQIPGAATGRADGKLTCHRCLAGGREGGCLLVTNVLPDDLAVTTQCLGEPVDRVSRQAVYAAHARGLERRHHHVRNGEWCYASLREARLRRVVWPVPAGHAVPLLDADSR